MNRVVHFEIHAADPERAARFYGEVFGWLAYFKDTEGNLFGMLQPEVA